MIFSKRDLELSRTVGQGVVYISRLFWQSTITVIVVSGESGLVYKGYLNTALGKELVAVKTGKGYYALLHVNNMYHYVSVYLQHFVPVVIWND